jgi:hypothetical protein
MVFAFIVKRANPLGLAQPCVLRALTPTVELIRAGRRDEWRCDLVPARAFK